MTPELFKLHFNALPYDKLCQDIEYIGLIGHSKSHLTWEKMRDMYDWNNKKIADLGCFHGYYCFKAEQEGAIVTGFDQAQSILDTANLLKHSYGSKVMFTKWKGGEIIPPTYDIALLLSVLYFFPNQELAIKNIQCKHLLCDVADNSLELIKKYYTIKEHKISWGIGQRNGIGNLMLCERK